VHLLDGFGGARIFPADSASLNLQAWLTKPIAGVELNSFSSPAVSVQTSNQTVGTIVTHA